MRRYELTDEQWRRLEPLLLPEQPRTRQPNHDYRTILNGIIWFCARARLGVTSPRRYGPVGTVSSRFYCWRALGVWDWILSTLQAKADARGEVHWVLACRRRHYYLRPPARHQRTPAPSWSRDPRAVV